MSFGRYRELALLGQGGMARVSLAALPGALGTQKLVVIKEILPQLALDPDFVAMFTDEARLASKLDHPNLVQCFEVGEADGRYFIVMEYLEGQSLSAVLGRTRRKLPLGVYLHVLTRVLDGLHAAHELSDLSGGPLGVVHRDVTPQNVFLTYGGAIKLVDFGIAKAKGAAVLTETGVFKGKLAYAAPEQIANDAIDRRSDVFAVGVLLWEGLTRRRINAELAEPAMLHRRINGLDPKAAAAAPEAPAELAAICDRAMSLDRAERFATAAEMREAIDAFIEKAGVRTTDAEVGALVAREFEQERSQVRRLVQERLAAPTGSHTPTPLLPPPPPSSTSGVTGQEATLGEGASGRLVTSPTSSTNASVSVELEPGGSRARLKLALLSVFSAAVLAAVAAFALRGARPAGPTSPATAAAETASAAPAAPAADAESAQTVEVTASAAPATARFTLDGVPLEGNPLTRRLPRDGASHALTVAAPGFASEQRVLLLDRDVRLELSLKPERAAPGGRPPVKPAGGSEDPRRRPSKPIDTNDPWGAPR